MFCRGAAAYHGVRQHFMRSRQDLVCSLAPLESFLVLVLLLVASSTLAGCRAKSPSRSCDAPVVTEERAKLAALRFLGLPFGAIYSHRFLVSREELHWVVIVWAERAPPDSEVRVIVPECGAPAVDG
jgi:hypothetical protein